MITVTNYVDRKRRAVTGFGIFAMRGSPTAQTSCSPRVHEVNDGNVLLMHSGALQAFVFPLSSFANLLNQGGGHLRSWLWVSVDFVASNGCRGPDAG